MTTWQLHETRLPRVLERWQETAEVRMPHRGRDGEATLDVLGPGTAPELDFRNFVLPPGSRALLRDGAVLPTGTHAPDDGPVVVVGIRPCDATAIRLLDGRRSCVEPVGPAPGPRRSRLLLVSLACTRPHMTCFCLSVGGAPDDERGADVAMVPAGEELVLSAHTTGGQRLLEAAADLLEPARPETTERAEELLWAAEERIAPVRLRGLGEVLAGPIDPAVWRELGETCRGCAVCTLLCPVSAGGEREAPTSGGSRGSGRSTAGRDRWEAEAGTAVRPAWQRRAAWWEDRVRSLFGAAAEAGGGYLCVGCGRCVRHCPMSLDLRAVLRRLRGPG